MDDVTRASHRPQFASMHERGPPAVAPIGSSALRQRLQASISTMISSCGAGQLKRKPATAKDRWHVRVRQR
jgi:hypothetical protein